jgi:hypothetical protein
MTRPFLFLAGWRPSPSLRSSRGEGRGVSTDALKSVNDDGGLDTYLQGQRAVAKGARTEAWDEEGRQARAIEEVELSWLHQRIRIWSERIVRHGPFYLRSRYILAIDVLSVKTVLASRV